MISSNFCGILFWFTNYENTRLDDDREKEREGCAVRDGILSVGPVVLGV